MGAVSACTSTPASEGPPAYATARLVDSRPFAARTCSRGTVAVKNELYERSKKTAHEPVEEDDEVELQQGERVERQPHRNRDEQRGTPDVRGDHDLALHATRVDPDADRQRKQQVRQPEERRQHAHLGRRRVERQHGGERNRERADLVAEDRDRHRSPQPHERGVPAERRDRRRDCARCGHARRIRTSPLMEVARSSTSGASSAGRESRTYSGSQCHNTGEIAGVMDHEWGHGMDNNGVNGNIEPRRGPRRRPRDPAYAGLVHGPRLLQVRQLRRIW